MISTLERMSRPAKPPTKQTRMRLDMATKLEVIGTAREKDLPDLMADLFSDIVDREYAKALDELSKLRNKKKPNIE